MLRCLALVFCTAITCSALAQAQAVPCFLVPQADAQASVGNKPISKAMRVDDCRGLLVTKGEVRVIYSNQDGLPETPLIRAGETLKAVDFDVSGAGSMRDIEALISGAPTGAGGPRAPLPLKNFDGSRKDASSMGVPYQSVHLPRDGLLLELRGTPPDSTYSIEEKSKGRILARGSAVGPIRIEKSALGMLPGVAYRFVVSAGQKVVMSSDFELAQQDDASAIDQYLQRISAVPALDKTSQLLALALLYEGRSLGFNRDLVIKEMSK